MGENDVVDLLIRQLKAGGRGGGATELIVIANESSCDVSITDEGRKQFKGIFLSV